MTKLIPILSGRCLVVELPEGETHPRCLQGGWTYNGTDMCTLIWHEGGKATQSISIPVTGWRIIGMLSEVTEEQAAIFVKLHATIKKYKDYLTSKEHPTNVFTKNALESLESAILAEGYTFTPSISEIYDSESECMRVIESRVLDRSRCLLLGREV